MLLVELLLTFSSLLYPHMQGSPDLKAAREVADYLGTVHHEFHFTVQVLLIILLIAEIREAMILYGE